VPRLSTIRADRDRKCFMNVGILNFLAIPNIRSSGEKRIL